MSVMEIQPLSVMEKMVTWSLRRVQMTTEYAEKIVQLFTQHSQDDLSRVSYEVAEPYLDEHIAQRWYDLVQSAQTK